MKTSLSRLTHPKILRPDNENFMSVRHPSKPTWIPLQWQGALWKILACACFAGINGVVRYLTGGAPTQIQNPLPATSLAFFQNVFGTLFMLPWVFKHGIGSLKTNHPGIHSIRVISAVLGVLLWYLSLSYMPIAQAVALSFTGPVFTVIGARFILQEQINGRRGLAMVLSFLGAFLILRPDKAFFNHTSDFSVFIALLPLSSAVAIAVTKLMTRKLGAQQEPAHTMTIYLLLFMAPVSLIPALFDWVTPSLHHWPWLILMGILAAGAHFSTSQAYVVGEITFLTPFGFSKFLFSGAIGYLAFSEFSHSWALWVGSAIIFSSVILVSNPAKPKLNLK